MSAEQITPQDIRRKLTEIQDDATETVEGARNQLIAIGAAVALLLVVVAFLLGRRGGSHRNTIIEVKRT